MTAEVADRRAQLRVVEVGDDAVDVLAHAPVPAQPSAQLLVG